MAGLYAGIYPYEYDSGMKDYCATVYTVRMKKEGEYEDYFYYRVYQRKHLPEGGKRRLQWCLYHERLHQKEEDLSKDITEYVLWATTESALTNKSVKYITDLGYDLKKDLMEWL